MRQNLRGRSSAVRPAGPAGVSPKRPVPETTGGPAAVTIAVARGCPTSEELAAVLIALQAARATAPPASDAPASRDRPWSNEHAGVARTVPGAWGPGPRVVLGPLGPSGAPSNRPEGRTRR